MGLRTGDQCEGARIHEEVLEILLAETTSDVSSAIQMLEELVRKYEHRGKKYDNDLNLQRLHDVLPKQTAQLFVLETYESMK